MKVLTDRPAITPASPEGTPRGHHQGSTTEGSVELPKSAAAVQVDSEPSAESRVAMMPTSTPDDGPILESNTLDEPVDRGRESHHRKDDQDTCKEVASARATKVTFATTPEQKHLHAGNYPSKEKGCADSQPPTSPNPMNAIAPGLGLDPTETKARGRNKRDRARYSMLTLGIEHPTTKRQDHEANLAAALAANDISDDAILAAALAANQIHNWDQWRLQNPGKLLSPPNEASTSTSADASDATRKHAGMLDDRRARQSLTIEHRGLSQSPPPSPPPSPSPADDIANEPDPESGIEADGMGGDDADMPDAGEIAPNAEDVPAPLSSLCGGVPRVRRYTFPYLEFCTR